MKSKSLSLYWTQYSRGLYVLLSYFLTSVMPNSPSTSLMMSGTDLF
jgi:hypothetical protein